MANLEVWQWLALSGVMGLILVATGAYLNHWLAKRRATPRSPLEGIGIEYANAHRLKRLNADGSRDYYREQRD